MSSETEREALLVDRVTSEEWIELCEHSDRTSPNAAAVAPSDAEVERLARHVDSNLWKAIDEAGADASEWRNPSYHTRALSLRIAATYYAALRAMDRERGLVTVPREPTEAMLRGSLWWSQKKHSTPISFQDAIGCYHAMIEAHEREAGQ